MIPIASRLVQNNRPKQYSSSSSYSVPIQKTPEQIAAEEERRLAIQKRMDAQTMVFNQCQERAALSPPEYPIKIRLHNKYFTTILHNNESMVFASSFNEAVKMVQADIESSDSDIMNQYKKSSYNYYQYGDVLRLSSANKSIFRRIDFNSPSGEYYFETIAKTIPCWVVIISSAKPTMMSSYRIASQNNSTTGGKTRAKKSTFKKSTSKKSTFLKGRAKKSRKTTRRKG